MAPRLPIRVKTAAALAVPLSVLVAIIGLDMLQGARELREVRAQTDLATATIGPSGLINAIQHERNFSGLWLVGTEDVVELPVDSVAEARQASDRALAALRDEVERKGGDVARIYAPAVDSLDERLADQRALVDGYDEPRVVTAYNATAEQAFNGYSAIITSLAEATSRVNANIDDHDLRVGVELIDLASREIDQIAHFVRLAMLTTVVGDGRFSDPDEIARAARLNAGNEHRHEQILQLATGRYADLGRELQVESDATGVREVSREMVRTGDIDLDRLLDGVSAGEDDSYYGFQSGVAEQLRSRAAELNSAAEDRQRFLLAVVGSVLAVAGVATPLAVRSITRPLRSLTLQATDVAENRLPTAVRRVHEAPLGDDVTVPELHPVTVRSHDEVADVTEMLNHVQTTALDLATEQAVLRRNVADALTNLARRNQNLLGRQLSFITELERDETRPDALASLFRLDQQATRMRRNAESLLVLAGVEQRRHAQRPAPVVDIIRAALGEVDDFRRVTIAHVQPADIAGPAVADLTHLLAELIENALHFSAPDQSVTTYGRLQHDGYVVLVVDAGYGMSPEEIAQANRRLAGAEDFTIAPSRYLGHYVTAALAARHEITVRLRESEHLGITAVVHLPPAILAGDPQARVTAGRAGAPSPDDADPGHAHPVTGGGRPTAARST